VGHLERYKHIKTEMKFHKYQTVPVILIFILITSSCNKDEKPDETPPVLSVTPVDISTVTSIIAFGVDLTPTQKNPAFEYRVNNSTVQVRSACKGYIEEIRLNDNFPDYEVWIKMSSNSIWTIIYDHVLNLNISKNDNVNPGDLLGIVGTENRTELQINKIINNNEELSFCPFDFGTSEFIQQHKIFTETWCLNGTVIP
jgi:hypothetical protein